MKASGVKGGIYLNSNAVGSRENVRGVKAVNIHKDTQEWND